MKVKSKLDSRIILDQSGGESLIGNGDMLYQSGSMFEPIRIQGCYIDQDEMSNIVLINKHIQHGTIDQLMKHNNAA